MKHFISRFASAMCLVILAIFTFAVTHYAQDLDDVTISGRIVDSNNAPIVGATVTATLVTTNAERTVTTDEEGRYRFVELQPGLYKISASQTGFGTKEKIDLETIAGQNVQLDFTLAPAGVVAESTVTIEADSSTVDTTRTVVGGTVTQREIEELPNNSRDALDLVFTLGGVSEEPLSTRDLAQDRGSGRNDSAPGNTPEEAGIFALTDIHTSQLRHSYLAEIRLLRDIHISQ